jgi:SAM-dependent methyltransferase
MRHTLLSDICCPVCKAHLEIKETEQRGLDVIEGTLWCARCSVGYPICKGIPNLLSGAGLEDHKSQEIKGWVSLWDKKGMYAHPTLEDSFRLPYVGHIWTDVARMFDFALQEMNLQGNEVILEIGAGQGWACRYFAEKGCRVIGIDLVDDEWYGLGRSWAIMEHAHVYFEPLLADGEDLPFFPERFDYVFLCGALHHFRDFGKVLKQSYRVLKHGGRLVAAGEPSVYVFAREQDVQAGLDETREGITERRPNVAGYWWHFRKAGFQDIRIDTFETYNTSTSQIYNWIVAVRHSFFRILRQRYKLLAWLLFSFLLMLPSKWAGRFTLFINGGNLLLRATKPIKRELTK